eukprot:TRINITY_DN339_c0_g2_i2.p1 TRINITY_DN339_c0_g2~~TRINITY_DN339_c0_g2_i2.p1  ORF type:complete len:339 (+),score=75.85 TRINITY_DN339_c0_g2_i2:510-1526(+)
MNMCVGNSTCHILPSQRAKMKVLVTGASGFVAGELIKQLFARGFQVRGTVRDVSKYDYLRTMYPQLELFPADLLAPGSFDEAVQGVDVVFHTASPFFFSVNDPQKDLVDPALNGTKNVLSSVDKSPSVKRVVLTSSVAAVAGKSKQTPDHVFTEEDWNEDSTVSFEPYRYSKTVAEKAAWDINKGKPWTLVTICPTFVLGPVQTKRADAASIKTAIGFLNGSMKETGVPPNCFGIVDVRDVAAAHIEAAVRQEAHGRYIISSPTGVSQLELAQLLARHPTFKDYPLPTTETAPVAYRMKIDTSKARRDLGYAPDPDFVYKAITDMAQSLADLGMISSA